MASTAPSSSSANPATVELGRLSVDQLKAVKEQTELEINLLQDSLNNIKTATSRLESASSALDDLSLRPLDHRILVPLASSLYVPASLAVSDRALVDVGTGYFIEKTMAEGKDYCERKINLLKSNFDQLIEASLSTFPTSFSIVVAIVIISLVISRFRVMPALRIR